MARGDTLRRLFKTLSQANREELMAVAIEIIQEEKQKNHLLLARDLEEILKKSSHETKILASNNSPWYNYPDVPKDKDSGLPLIEVSICQLDWDAIVLSETNSNILERIVEENRKQDIIRSHALVPASKLLFCGPPGCGKTITAKVLSSVLNLPLVYVNLSSIFSSYLGETSTNLRKIFDYIKQSQWVLLFDEFDAIAKDRNVQNEHGEVKRLVNSLIQLIDRSNSQSLLIATTNYESLLDRAIWRRFDEILIFEKPNSQNRISLLKKKLSGVRHRINIDKFAMRLKGATGADIERICFDAIKTMILKDRNVLTESELEQALIRHINRRRIIEQSIQKQQEMDNDRI